MDTTPEWDNSQSQSWKTMWNATQPSLESTAYHILPSGHSTSHPSPMQKRMALLPQDSQDSSLWALGSISSLRYHYLNQVQRWQRLFRCDSSPLFEHSSLVLYPYELNKEFTASPMCPVCMHGEQP